MGWIEPRQVEVGAMARWVARWYAWTPVVLLHFLTVLVLEKLQSPAPMLTRQEGALYVRVRGGSGVLVGERPLSLCGAFRPP